MLQAAPIGDRMGGPQYQCGVFAAEQMYFGDGSANHIKAPSKQAHVIRVW